MSPPNSAQPEYVFSRRVAERFRNVSGEVAAAAAGAASAASSAVAASTAYCASATSAGESKDLFLTASAACCASATSAGESNDLVFNCFCQLLLLPPLPLLPLLVNQNDLLHGSVLTACARAAA